MKKIFKSLFLNKKNLFFIIFSFALLFPVLVFAQYGLREAASTAGLQSGDLPTLIGNVIGAALSLVGVVFFLLLLYGGILWMTARGKEDQANKAKDTITAAVIGLIIILTSFALTNFIFQSLGGGSPGGGGGGGSDTDDRCEQYGEQIQETGFACRDIDNCTVLNTRYSFGSQTSLEDKRNTCEVEPDACVLGICPGGSEIVCCR